MEDIKAIQELIRSNSANVKKFNELIDTLKAADMDQKRIDQAIEMRDKFQSIVDYNQELLDQVREDNQIN